MRMSTLAGHARASGYQGGHFVGGSGNTDASDTVITYPYTAAISDGGVRDTDRVDFENAIA